MELLVETFTKPDTDSDTPSDDIGQSTLFVGEKSYRILEEVERELTESGTSEKFIDLEASMVEIVELARHIDLKEPKIRVFMDEGIESAMFHLVARSSADDSLVYTEPTLVRFTTV